MRSLLHTVSSLLCTAMAAAAADVAIARSEKAAGFQIAPVPPPATSDAGAKAKITVIAGEKDGNGAGPEALVDGKLPISDDQPDANFFFAPGSEGGRIAMDLGTVMPVRSIASYSWHGGGRAPQVYKLYTADGRARGFDPAPAAGKDPAKSGWSLLATVDTRAKSGPAGGQHAAEVANKNRRALGSYRYLLFDISRTSPEDGFGQTFFSEIDVVGASQRESDLGRFKAPDKIAKSYKSKDGKYRYIIDSTKSPQLTEWSEKELLPVIEKWYPKLVALLPSDGYRAPDEVTFEYRDDMGGTPAYAVGNRIALSSTWFPGQLKNEAKGCVVHEMGHVVQNYWRASVTNRKPKETPGWVTEGICDYLRWFLYEPESKGAGVSDPNQARYDASYRITANFLDWVIEKKDKDLLQKLNAAAREGKYEESLWEEWTGMSLSTLGEEWKAAVADGKR